MTDYPLFIKVKDKKYAINTDYRVAIECQKISLDESIGAYEKCLAIIYLLLGEEALKDTENQNEIFELIVRYLNCNKKHIIDLDEEIEPSMDFEQDEGYIRASFAYCYPQEDLSKPMHWWRFYELLEGLSTDCILNRVREIREEPLNDKKGKAKEKLIKAKKSVALERKKTFKEKELDKKWEEKMRKR